MRSTGLFGIELGAGARVCPGGLPRHAPLPLKPPPHALVAGIDRLTEHQRASSNDAVDPARIAFPDGLLGHAAVAKGAMEPHSRYVVNAAVPYDLN